LIQDLDVVTRNMITTTDEEDYGRSHVKPKINFLTPNQQLYEDLIHYRNQSRLSELQEYVELLLNEIHLND
jgi:hypothetical protein